MNWNSDSREELKNELESDADWRAEKAVQYPQDHRNKIAEQRLRELARGVENVPDELMARFSERVLKFEDFVDVWPQKCGSIGFGYMPQTTEELLEDTIAGCRWRYAPSTLRGWMTVVSAEK